MCPTGLLLTVLLGWSLFPLASSAPACMDNSNKPVDWFIIYKVPVRYNTTDWRAAGDPLRNDHPFPPHLYMDSNSLSFHISNQSLNETNQALAYTLQQAYKAHKSQNVGYILHNDEKPVEAGGQHADETYGHTKGLTVFDDKAGFWMVHSAPKFPPPTNSSYQYASNAVRYGQHFLCVSLFSAKDVSKVGFQMMHNEPWIYDWNIPLSLAKQYPVMLSVVNRTVPSTKTSLLTVKSVAGKGFLSFAKTGSFNDDLYAALIAPSLQCNLSVETWRQGEADNNLPPFCGTYKVENAEYVQTSTPIGFRSYWDHSKFAVCQATGPDPPSQYVCIGDINRQKSQAHRGGGALCIEDNSVFQQYLSMVTKTDKCNNP